MVVLLISIILHSALFGFANYNEFAFTYKGNDILIVEGEGAFNDLEKHEKVANFPLWCFTPVTDNRGNLYGNAFNGLNYLGLYKYEILTGNNEIINITKKGAPTNYIQKIYSLDNALLLILLEEPYLFFFGEKEISKFPWVGKIRSYFGNGIEIFFLTYNSEVINYKNGNFRKIGKYPRLEELYYVDKYFVMGRTRKYFVIWNRNNNKTNLIKSSDDYNVIKTAENYFFITNQKDKVFFFDGSKLFDISELEIFPVFYDMEMKRLILFRNDEFEKVDFEPEVHSLNNLKVSFNEYYSEISPKKTETEIIACGLASKDDSIVKVNLSKKIRVGNISKLNKAEYYGFDENLTVYKGGIPSLTTINYINAGILGWILVLFVTFVSLKVVFKRQYRLFPLLFALSFILLLLPSLLFPFKIFLTGFYKYGLLSLFISVMVFISCIIYDKTRKQFFEEPMYFKLFAHGSIGLNNLIRLYRLSGTETKADVKPLLSSAAKLFETATVFEIEKLLKSLVCSPKWLIRLVMIDILKTKIQKGLNVCHKGDFNNCKKINRHTKKIIDEIEKLKSEYNEKRQTDISKIIRDVVDVHTSALNGEIKIFTEIEEKLYAVINPREVSKIIDNLLENAIVAVKRQNNPKIKVFSKKKDDFIEIIVSDNGRGIETENIETIFTPDYSTKKKGGLGLYETKKIVEKYLGEITYSRSNEMSIFKIIIRGVI